MFSFNNTHQFIERHSGKVITETLLGDEMVDFIYSKLRESVAMVEVVAMMIGDMRQCYSSYLYDEPEDIKIGMWLERGCPKSLYRPGSSTTILLFEK
jgi:hypothetical protein